LGISVIDIGPMTVAEFYAFTDARPDDEKWELIDGEPILNAAPSETHQRIVKNILLALAAFERRPAGAAWEVLPGLGVRVSDTRRPEPDLLVVPRGIAFADQRLRDRSDAIVTFEILSPSTARRDLRWKRAAYTSLPSLAHYVVVAQDAVEVVVFARDAGFAERRLISIDESIELPSLGVTLPLAEIYRDTGLV
jgi:Uma2 family endonuclease